jgi:cell division cycle 14
MGTCTYKCTVLDCLQGLEIGMYLGWYNYKNFNFKEYEYYEKVEHGDMNWIVPGRFLAFSGPSKTDKDPEGWRTFTPEDYAPIFKKMGITTVVRLNQKIYERERFIRKGFKHLDLYFIDGTTPDSKIVNKFLEEAESEEGGIAIHCKAGLGRTGTLIALYCMKHFGFPARAFIGWIRICRPGSILGPQQHYLCEMQEEMFEAG